MIVGVDPISPPEGWFGDDELTFTRRVMPFGTLVVSGSCHPDWYVFWRYGYSTNVPTAAKLVAGPFRSPDDAFDAAVTWLFDSWSTIETQLEPEAAYRRDPILNLIFGSFIALLVGVLAGIALAELL